MSVQSSVANKNQMFFGQLSSFSSSHAADPGGLEPTLCVLQPLNRC